MALVQPFKAIRPTRDKVALVTTRSYDIYKKKELNDILRLNPFSFLHILLPGFKFHKSVRGTKRFKMVHNRYGEFKENGIFDQETAQLFRDNVLARGGTADPMELYVAFRGKEPTKDALLKNRGLLE